MPFELLAMTFNTPPRVLLSQYTPSDDSVDGIEAAPQGPYRRACGERCARRRELPPVYRRTLRQNKARVQVQSNVYPFFTIKV